MKRLKALFDTTINTAATIQISHNTIRLVVLEKSTILSHVETVN